MNFPALEKEVFIGFDKNLYESSVENLIIPTLAKFQTILRSYTLFNLIFLLLIAGEIAYFFVHLAFLAQTFVMAIYFALIFATLFCMLHFTFICRHEKLKN